MTQFDPRSRSLIAYGEHHGSAPSKTGIRYHPVHYGDHITYAVDPRDVTSMGVNDEIYIKTVNIKGVTTHSNVLNMSEKFVGLRATRQYGSDINPYDYAEQLQNGEYVELADWKLTYGVRPSNGYDTQYRIVLNDLPDIALNTRSTITVTTPSVTLSIPTTALLRYNQATVVVDIGQRTSNGFAYYVYVEADGAVVSGSRDHPLFYGREFKQRCVLTELQEHMLKNKNYEEFIAASNLISEALKLFDNDSDFSIDDEEVRWQVQDPRSNDEEEYMDVDVKQEMSKFDAFAETIARFLGAVGSVRTALSDYITREARFSDMENTSKNIGGDIVGDKINQNSPIDWLVEIDYPVADQYMIGNNILTPGEFTQNESHSIDVYQRFDSLSSFLTWLNDNYGTNKVIGIDGGLIVDYNNYNTYWKQMIDRGLLL